MGHSGCKRVSKERCFSIHDSYKLGVDQKSIAEYFKIPKSTIPNVIKRLDTVSVPNRIGRQRKLDDELLKNLEEFVARYCFMLLDMITTTFSTKENIQVSESNFFVI